LERPTTTTLVEFHSVSGDFGYSAEAAARTSFYTFYGYPSLFRDGKDIWSGSSPYDWRDSITARVSKPSPVTMTISGSYNASTNQGTVTVQVRNDSTATISNSKVYICITEDSLYNVDPNGHAWHNHMFRDFLPDQNGDTVTVAPAQTRSVTKSFTIDAGWNENRCRVAAWYQLSTGTKDAFQSGGCKVMSLVAIQEEEPYPEPLRPLVTLQTNPCVTSARFTLNLPDRESYAISIYDLTGVLVQTVHGTAGADHSNTAWNLCDGNGSRVSSGVYLYRLTSPSGQATGKIVVR
jgi:hypothetical protein